MLINFIINSNIRYQIFNNRQFNIGLLLNSLMLGYFCLTTLWSTQPKNFVSDITHAVYILLFIIMFRLIIIQGWKEIAFWTISIGIIVLAILTFYNVNKESFFIGRLTNGFFGAPSNVIDLAGYFSLGIFIFCIIIRDTGIRWLYLPIIVLIIGILLTQSRGPLLSLICSLVIIYILQPIKFIRYFYILLFIFCLVIIFLLSTHFGSIFISRIESSYQQSFIRFNIWKHTIELVMQKPFFGWGLNKKLFFINQLGESITTTHNLYLAALLKGGFFGFLMLILVMSYSLFISKKYLYHQYSLEISMFFFTINFYLTQGMFIISNPSPDWVIFWFPLAIILNASDIKYQDSIPNCFIRY